MGKFKHYILTRWNLIDPATDIYNYGINDPEDWMRHRINLFERYCLPSIMAQTCQDFTWVLAFSNKTPADITRRYRNLKNIQVIFEYPATWLRNNYEGEWLLTTRFDNDDILLPDFVEKVQGHVEKSTKKGSFRTEIIDVLGVQWDMINNKWYDSGRNMHNSPFMSLFENTKKPYLSCYVGFGLIKEKIKTVLYCSHTKMVWHFPTCRIEEPLAVMCIHDRNLGNRIVGGDLLASDTAFMKSKYKI